MPSDDSPSPSTPSSSPPPSRREVVATSLRLLVYVTPVIESFRASRLYADSVAGSAATASLLGPQPPPVPGPTFAQPLPVAPVKPL